METVPPLLHSSLCLRPSIKPLLDLGHVGDSAVEIVQLRVLSEGAGQELVEKPEEMEEREVCLCQLKTRSPSINPHF